MTMSKHEALDALRATHEAFVGRAEAVGDAGWVRQSAPGGWRVRDIAAHIAAWDRLVIADIADLRADIPPSWVTWDDATTDIVNAMQVRAAASWPIERLREELVAARSALIETVAGLDEQVFAKGQRVGDTIYSPRMLCAYFIDHDRAHILELSD